MNGSLSAHLKAVLTAGLAAVALPVAQALAADLGPHGGLASGDSEGCAACHVAPIWRGTLGDREVLAVPDGGHPALGDPVTRLCWRCHRQGNPFGARPIGPGLLAEISHGMRGIGASLDAWTQTGVPPARPRSGDLPSEWTGRPTCTTCHDVHNHASPLFLRKTTTGGDYSALCSDCHPGRENPGLVGSDNIFSRGARPYSNHPTGVAVADLAGNGASAFPLARHRGGPIACGDCHDVHERSAAGSADVPGLLRLEAGERTSDLCRRCHLPPVGSATHHPMEGVSGRLPYPSTFASSDGVPAAWKPRIHRDRGAEGFVVGAKRAPRCSSCHDLHGGLPMTSLLYGPVASADGSDEWCFSCHPAAAVTPQDHGARAPGSEALACTSCHGRANDDGGGTWDAHGEFRLLRVPSPASKTRTGALPPQEVERRRMLSRLLLILRDGQPFASENAAVVLAHLRDPDSLEGILAALDDPRPDVRERTIRVLGTLGDESLVPTLEGIVRETQGEPQLAAAEALLRIGGDRARSALLPLLQDPSPEVRRSAVRAFAGVREPQAYPALVDLLRDESKEVRIEATNVVASVNDARILELILNAPAETFPAVMPILLAIIDDLSDPAGARPLIAALRHDHRLVRIAAAGALGRYPEPMVVDALLTALVSGEERFRRAVVRSLGALKDSRAAAALLTLLKDPEERPGIRSAAVAAVAQIKSPEAVPVLIDGLSDPLPSLQYEISRALVSLTCRNFGQEQKLWREWWERQPRDFPLGRCFPSAPTGAEAEDGQRSP